MNAHVEQDIITNRVKLWLWAEDPLAGKVHALGPDLDTFTTHAAGETWEPISLSREIAEAVGSALAKMGRPEEATQRHLSDAIAVRDRLLALVEKTA